jgi:hypothetical protein
MLLINKVPPQKYIDNAETDMLRNEDIRILLKTTGTGDYKQNDQLNWKER